MTPLSKNARVLQYLAQKARRPLTTFQLQKLPYLADLLARKQTGEPVTSFNYIWYDYGPFDSELYAAIEELERAGLSKTKPQRFWSGHNGRLLRPLQTCDDLGLSPAERYILDRVCSEYEGVSTKELKKLAYGSEPMRDLTERKLPKHRVPMEIVNFAEAECGCDLEHALEQSRQIEAGNYALATEFFNALRAEAVRRDAGADIRLH